MEMKEQLINSVIRNMEPELEVNQLKKLKIVLTINIRSEERNELERCKALSWTHGC